MAEVVTDPNSYLLQLDAFPCALDAPLIASAPTAVAVTGNVGNIDLADINVYEPERNSDKHVTQTVQYAVREAGYIAKMENLLGEGQKLLASLYSYRSCSRAIPQVQNDQMNKQDMYRATYEVLQPEVAKMQKFMAFRDSAISTVVDVFADIIPEMSEKDFFASTDLLTTCAAVLDMFVIMDAMKNIKGSMNNDFSMFRRAVQSSGKEMNEDETIMQHKLYSFLANQDQYSSELKNALLKLAPTYEEIIVDMLETCADLVEHGRHLLPQTKHTYLRAMSFGLYLLDKEGDENDINKRKKFKLERFGKIFRTCPVVPLFADQYVSLSTIYSKAPHLTATKWEDADDVNQRVTLSRYYSIINHIDTARADYSEYMTHLKRTMNSLRLLMKVNGALTPAECTTVYNTVAQGVTLLANLSTKVLEQSAWKYANPVNPQITKHIPSDVLSYELAVRYNYSTQEKRALIEFIAMIKNLSAALLSLERPFVVAIHHHIYYDSQNFAKLNLGDYLAHLSKKKKATSTIIKHLRDVAYDGSASEEDASSKSRKEGKSMQTLSEGDAPARLNPISQTQLHFVRTLLDYCFSEKAKGMKGTGLMREKDFKDSQVNEVGEFLKRSDIYLAMLDLEGTVRELSDLSDLWFKEFYLELSKKVQFPISMSLPWILTEYMLECNDLEMLQYIFYPFELYNDAANRTLNKLRSRFIYDEITAEVSLCFDQLIFKLSQKVFQHFKKAASCMVLAPDLKVESDPAHMELPLDAYDDILAQKQYRLLGRSLNVGQLIGGMMNQYLRKSIDTAISRYEGSDLTYIVGLDTLLRSAQMTHQLFSERVILDPFDDMLAEIDDSVSMSAANGRIVTHTARELINDFVPNFCYNNVTNRFLRGPVSYVQESTRHSFPKAPLMYLYGSKALSVAFGAQNSLFKEFIGAPHFRTLVRWIGRHGVAVMIAELSKHVDGIVKNTMTAYINVISKGTPQTMKLPLFEYGTSGTFEYFAAHLKPLITYRDLKSEVLQAFREVGNAVITVKTLEDVLALDETLRETQTVETTSPEADTAYAQLRDFDPLFNTEEYPLPFREWAQNTQMLYAPKPPTALLGPFLDRLRATLESVGDDWQAEGHLENPRAFFRIWSALQFTFCVPSVGEGKVIRELFGEGLSWAGCTFIHLLDQTDVYTAFDFNNHILSVQRADRKAAHLTFGFGQYGGTITAAGVTEKSALGVDLTGMTPGSAAAAATTATAAGLRADVIQFLESAAFYQNVNEEVFAALYGMQAVA
ncbi:Cytoplasmic FMR1-interacting protein 2 [Gaertneriomyces sp. JEL0708]|nr:Cytoplasmic FMR1-interacting protein 2 [Gaertneriomyces sp. JEL0708]